MFGVDHGPWDLFQTFTVFILVASGMAAHRFVQGLIVSGVTCCVSSAPSSPLDACELWWLEDKREDYQDCSVLYCVTHLYTVICTLIWAVLTDELFLMRNTVGVGCRNSVCLSVRPCMLCDKTKQCTVDILIPHKRTITLLFWQQQRLVGDAPSV